MDLKFCPREINSYTEYITIHGNNNVDEEHADQHSRKWKQCYNVYTWNSTLVLGKIMSHINHPIRTFKWLDIDEIYQSVQCYLVRDQESNTSNLQPQVTWVNFGKCFGKVIPNLRYNTLDQMGVPANFSTQNKFPPP